MDCINNDHLVLIENEGKYNRDGPFKATPEALRFNFEEKSSNLVKKLKILNVNNSSHRLHVLPPITNFFKMTAPQNGLIAPGMSISIKVSFLPSKVENKRHYRDVIRILNDSEVNNFRNLSDTQNIELPHGSMLLIPLTAEPHIPQSKIPDEIDFGCVKLGKRAESTFIISPSPSEKVIYFISMPEKNANFKIDPLQGILNENDQPAVITVIFTPTEYKIMNLKIKVCIPSSSMTPYSVLLTGTSKPWSINREIKGARKVFQNSEEHEKGVQKSKITRRCKQQRASINNDNSMENLSAQPCISKVPLNTIHGVAKFLSLKPVKERDPCFDLIGISGKYQDEEKVIYDKYQRIFLGMVQKEKERRQQIHISSQVALGNSRHSFDLDELAEIVFQRQISNINYQKSQKVFEEDFLLNNKVSIQQRRRTLRHTNEVIDLHIATQIDLRFLRHQILSKFIQCARKVIIKDRLTKRLEKIKAAFMNKVIPEVKKLEIASKMHNQD